MTFNTLTRNASVTLLTLVAAGSLFAQPGWRDRGGRGDYGRDYRGDRGSHIARVIADCENRTDEFRRSLRWALNQSRLDGTQREDELNADAARLERALNRVRDAWNGNRDFADARRNIGFAIAVSRDINRTMIRRRLHPNVERQWAIVRHELNRMAQAFDLPSLSW